MSVHMLDNSNSQGPHESDVNKNILLTLQKYSKYLYFSKLICQQLICQQLFLRGAQKLFKVRSWHFLIFSTAINQNKEIELDHVGIRLEKNATGFLSSILKNAKRSRSSDSPWSIVIKVYCGSTLSAVMLWMQFSCNFYAS